MVNGDERPSIISTDADSTGLAEIIIRAVADEDFELLYAWFGNVDFVTWWGGVPKTAAEVREECMGRYDAAREEHVWSFIIVYRCSPIGYIQAWSDDPSIVGIDVVLTPGMQNRGIGTKTVRQFAEQLKAGGWKHVGLDPATENSRAIRAFEKAGFRIVDRDVEPGHVWMQLMEGSGG